MTLPLTNPLEQLLLKQTLFLDLGLIYFALLLYWLFSIWDDLTEKNWIKVGVFSGLAFGVMATAEWGIATAGTAFSIGLCVGLALLHPAAAISLLASSLFLRPWELVEQDSYLTLLPRFSFVLCLGHLFLRYAVERKVAFEKGRLSLTLAVFAFWCFLSAIVAPEGAGAVGALVNGLVRSLFLYFILVEMVASEKTYRMVVGTLLLSFLFVGLVSVFQTEGDLRLKGFGAFQNSNDIAALMVLILPFAAMTALRKTESGVMRWAGTALTVTAMVAIFLSQSRGALLGVMVMVAAYVVLKYGGLKIRKKVLIPVAAGLLLVAVPATLVMANRSEEDLEMSSAGRMTYLKAGLRMGVKHPLLGVGFNGYPSNLHLYNTESLEEDQQMTAHNSWVLVFAETGLFGLILFTAAFWFCLKMAWSLYREKPELLLALVGYGVTMVFLSHSYLIYPYLLYALILCAYRLRKEDPAWAC